MTELQSRAREFLEIGKRHTLGVDERDPIGVAAIRVLVEQGLAVPAGVELEEIWEPLDVSKPEGPEVLVEFRMLQLFHLTEVGCEADAA